MSWWRVNNQALAFEFMVLVVDGRVAVCTVSAGIKIGQPWKDARKLLDEMGFTTTMVSAP